MAEAVKKTVTRKDLMLELDELNIAYDKKETLP
jgi:hypothetical protein